MALFCGCCGHSAGRTGNPRGATYTMCPTAIFPEQHLLRAQGFRGSAPKDGLALAPAHWPLDIQRRCLKKKRKRISHAYAIKPTCPQRHASFLTVCVQSIFTSVPPRLNDPFRFLKAARLYRNGFLQRLCNRHPILIHRSCSLCVFACRHF